MGDLVQTAQAGVPWLARLAHAPAPQPPPPPVDHRQWIAYDVPLHYDQPGIRNHARLVLPQDMSTEEAGRLCGFIRALAFTDEELAAADG